MNISQLVLANFRNHQKQTFSFSPSITIIIGKNASGKTNILEGVYFLSSSKSFRIGRDIETITFGKDISRIKGEITKDADRKILEVILTTGEVMKVATPFKKLLINNISKRSVDFVGILKCVLFWPEDMELVTYSPSIRRKYLDSVLVQVDREYRRTHASYERGLRQRNKLLEQVRENKAHMHQLLFWNQLLVKQGNYLTEKREEFISFINNFSLDSLAQTGLKFTLFYDKSIISESRLEQYKDAEVASGITLVGPHRDDFKFNKKEDGDLFELASFGSRGEQRLSILWLKLAELAFIENKTGDKPVLLLDDIFSELDHGHREIIFGMMGSQQSILTVTDRHLIPEKYYQEAKVIELGNGN